MENMKNMENTSPKYKNKGIIGEHKVMITRIYERTRPYYELLYAHKMQSRVLSEIHDRFDITYSELITEGVKAMRKFEASNVNSDEYQSSWEDTIKIKTEQRRFHESLFWEQHAKGVAILPSVDYVDQPF